MHQCLITCVYELEGCKTKCGFDIVIDDIFQFKIYQNDAH